MAKNAAEKAYQLGKKNEKTYMGCSQCVIAALQDAFNIRNDAVFKAASGLAGGGGGSIDGSCGAFSGGIMVLSSLLGREREDFADTAGAFHKSIDLARKLHDRFIQEYGSVICHNIQTKIFGRPYYIEDPDEWEKFEKAGGHEKHCPEVVGKAARWTAELIDEAGLI
jgi:C_GCAxxG_C_C family probable redox protein